MLAIRSSVLHKVSNSNQKQTCLLNPELSFQVFVNKKRIDLYSPAVLRSPSVGLWRGPPCSPDRTRCGPGRVCEPHLNSARCVCLKPPCPQEPKLPQPIVGREEGYVGDEAVRSINFNGYTIFEMKNKANWRQKRSVAENVLIKLKTSNRNGLVMLISNPKRSSPSQEFFLIALRKGYPEVAWNLGVPRSIIRIRGPKKITDNRWHDIHALRNGRLATLLVDGFPVSGFLNCSKTELVTDGWMKLGGYKSSIPGFPSAYNMGFTGCIQGLNIDMEEVDLQKRAMLRRGEMKSCTVPFEF